MSDVPLFIPGAPPFRIGSVFSRSLGILERQWARLLAIALVLGLPMIFGAVGRGMTLALMAHGPGAGPKLAGVAVSWALVALSCVVGAGAVGAQAEICFADLRGEQPRTGRAFRWGVRRTLPLFGTTLVYALLCMLGMMLLVVPGVMLGVAGAMAFPVCVIERAGPSFSLRRSWFLTRGNRWPLLGMAACCLLVALIPAAANLAIGFARISPHPDYPLLVLGGTLATLFQWALGAFLAVVGMVAYHDLVLLRDGVPSETVTSVFG